MFVTASAQQIAVSVFLWVMFLESAWLSECGGLGRVPSEKGQRISGHCSFPHAFSAVCYGSYQGNGSLQ